MQDMNILANCILKDTRWKNTLKNRTIIRLWGANETKTSSTMWAVIRKRFWFRKIHVRPRAVQTFPRSVIKSAFVKSWEVNCAELQLFCTYAHIITNQDAAMRAVYICKCLPLSPNNVFVPCSIYCLGISQRKFALLPGLVTPDNSRIDQGMTKHMWKGFQKVMPNIEDLMSFSLLNANINKEVIKRDWPVWKMVICGLLKHNRSDSQLT